MVRAGLAVLLVAPLAAAQAPPPAAAPARQPQPVTQELWNHLLAWEGVMKGATNFVSEKGTKTETHNVKRITKQFEATIWCLKPNLARMRLDRIPPANGKPDPNDFQTYICNGRSVWEYDGNVKTVTEYPLGPGGGVGDNLLLEFMSGSITARQAVGRFDIEWIKRDDPTYLYLVLTPHLERDRMEFEKLTLVLVRPGLAGAAGKLAYLPRIAELVKPNNEATERWDFPEPMINAAKVTGQQIGLNDFQHVKPGAGWREVKAAGPRGAGPRPARP